MKKFNTLIKDLLYFIDYIFPKNVQIIYFFYFIIILYYVLLFINNNFNLTFKTENNIFTDSKKIIETLHFVLKIIISIYLIIKFNPFYKIKYFGKNDKEIIFHSGILLFTSTLIIDPLILISNI